MNEQLVDSAIGVMLGTLITILVGAYFYHRATRDLIKEAGKLHKLSSLLVRGVHEAGLATFIFDEQGDPTGLKVNIETEETVHFSGTADLDAKANVRDK